MKPGPELDALVAEKVMAWRPDPQRSYWYAKNEGRWTAAPDWSPSTSIAAAEQAFADCPYFVDATVPESGIDFEFHFPDGRVVKATGETQAHARCLAALKAMGVEVPA